MWERASSVADLDLGEPRRDLRRFLLQQLAAGAKDEQIARSLDLSLRTVRRRIADVMSDLGADSRFQAGVEAARRGWI
jgi:DNA-binding NarL/FixJ family response regulator